MSIQKYVKNKCIESDINVPTSKRSRDESETGNACVSDGSDIDPSSEPEHSSVYIFLAKQRIVHTTNFEPLLDLLGLLGLNVKAKIQVAKNAMYKHVTGVGFVKAKSIKVLVIKDPHGAITAHVCANTITLPEGVLSPTKDLFVDAMKAVIADKSFNTV